MVLLRAGHRQGLITSFKTAHCGLALFANTRPGIFRLPTRYDRQYFSQKLSLPGPIKKFGHVRVDSASYQKAAKEHGIGSLVPNIIGHQNPR